MADVERTIQIIFGAQDQTGQAFQSVGSGLSSLSQSASTITQPLADITDQVLTVATGIGALGVAALGFAINEGKRFEDSLIELNKVLGEDEGVAADFADQIFNLSNKFGIAAGDVVEATAGFKQAGFTIEESFGLVETSLTAAASSELEAAEAADILVKSIIGLGEATIPAGALLDKFNAVQNNFNVSVGEIATGFADFSPLIEGFGLSIDDSIGLLTTIIEVFGSGTEAAQALRTTFINLSSGTGNAGAALKDLGVATEDSNGQIRSANDIFNDLVVALQGASKETINQTAAQIAGKANAAEFAAVLGNLTTVQEASAVAANSAGSAAVELAAQLQSLTTRTDQALVSFQNFAAQFGLQLLPASKDVVDGLAGIGQALSEALNSESFDPLINALEDRLGDLAKLFSDIAASLPDALEGVDFTPIIEGFDNIADSLSDVFGGVDLGSVEGLQQAIQFVVDTIGSLENVVSGIITGFQPFISTISALVSEFNELDGETKEIAGTILGFGKTVNSIVPAFEGLGAGFTAVGAGLTTIGAANILKLTTNFGKAAASATTLGATLGLAAKAVGPLAAALATGLSVGTLADQIPVVSQFVDKLIGPRGVSEAAKLAAQSSELLESQVDRLRERTGDLSITTDNYFQKLDQYIARQNDAKGATEGFGESVKGIAADLSNVTLSGEFKFGQEDTDLFQGTLDQLDEVQGKIQQTGEVAEQTSIAPTIDDKDLADINLRLETLASTERIARIDAFVEVNVSQAQAAAEIVASAFESANIAVQSTGETLVGLFDAALTSAKQASEAFRRGEGDLGLEDQFSLSEAIENEVDARKDALQVQQDLLKVELEIAKARAERLTRGISEITINAEGVAPAVRTIMFEILQEIQIEASADGAEFLLGLS